MQLEHRLSALLQLHLHSQLNTWLQWTWQRQLQDETRNIYVLGSGASYIRELTVSLATKYYQCSELWKANAESFSMSWRHHATGDLLPIPLEIWGKVFSPWLAHRLQTCQVDINVTNTFKVLERAKLHIKEKLWTLEVIYISIWCVKVGLLRKAICKQKCESGFLGYMICVYSASQWSRV